MFAVALALGFTLTTLQLPVYCQETTGGLQGTVKDPSGAVVPRAKVVVTGTSLVGSKELTTDSSGYYRFSNLPPGAYTLTVTAEGFETLKRGGLNLEVGHLPTVNLTLDLGTVKSVVEVNTEGPLIDTTSTTTLTNIPEEELQNVPHGTSFQSVIEFAPSARAEPLAGGALFGNGSGATSPGNGGNGGSVGYSIGGGSDSENSYLVEGQETANIIGGYSHTNVPFDFIQEVQLKSSGIEAEHGGALGGVVNVIMKKGSANWHGSIFTAFQDGAMNGSPNPQARYDQASVGTTTTWGQIDPDYQLYQYVRPHTSDVWPGFTLGGPVLKLVPKIGGKDRIFGEIGFNPEFNLYEEKLNYGPNNGGIIPFSQNTHTFYSYARVDAEVTHKIRVFGSWLYQGQRQAGESLPGGDSVQGYFNTNTGCFGALTTATNCLSSGNAPSNYAHDIGYTAPDITVNTGADVTITQSLVATTRFGYYFENYHDFGYPEAGTINYFAASGIGGTDTNGNPLPTNLQQGLGSQNLPLDSNFTHFNSNKAIQFDQDLAWFKSGKGGTHNFKFGYQMNRNSNYILQGFNTAYTQVWPGTATPYSPQGPTGAANCAAVEKMTGNLACVGTYGNLDIYDFGSGGKAISYNNGFYVQDAWTVGKGLTVNYGVRLEKEYLPAENQPSTAKITKPIDFGWGDKVAPRIGAAWDVFKDGKMKVFGGYGMFFDQMKLNVAISSYGGQYWQECWYAMMSPNLSSFNPAYNSDNRDCEGYTSSSTASWGSAGAPSGLTFLENQNLRAWPTTCSTCSIAQEGTAPGLKPYAQHESDFGIDYQIKPSLAFEGRWDRRRLDHVIEDSSIFNPSVGEVFVIVNPGQGVNDTFNDFYNFIYGVPPPACSGDACPASKTIPAARSYDGIELRLTKAPTNHWAGTVSYTWSNFRGNYTGLTSTDVADGGGGRNAPNNSRSFDEPHFSWNANGGSSSGLLPTDRPNALKGQAYYSLPWLKKFSTDFGIFQFAYSGTPLTSYLDVGYAFPGAFPTDIVNRGKWIDVTQNPSTGLITTSAPYTKRTPWYTDTDLNIRQAYKLTESKTLSFDATFANALNQHSVVSEGQQIDSNAFTSFIGPAGQTLFSGPAFYGAAMHPYNYTAEMNAAASSATGGPLTINSAYGKPYLYQTSRNIRLQLHFTF
jgi:hypothetical protein